MSEPDRENDKPLLEIRKYQNRRYYDTTNSEHLSMEQIHRKIREGFDVRVVDAKTGADITARVLTQILLEYEPLKLATFPSDLLLQMIRVNDKTFEGFFNIYFGEALGVFARSKQQFEKMLRQTRLLSPFGPELSLSTLEAFNPFGALFSPDRRRPSEDAFAEELAALRKQVEDLKTADRYAPPREHRKV